MFNENLQKVKEKFNEAMELEAGKNLRIKDIFTAIEKLESKQYTSIAEMQKACGFNHQNKVYRAIDRLLTEAGTPVKSLGNTRKRSKLSGNEFVEKLFS